MNRQWLAMEHYRMHVIQQWPDGPRKEAALAAARSAIASLQRAVSLTDAEICPVCAGGSHGPMVVEFPARPVRLTERAA
jgi:hypothetical protein